MTSLSRRRAGRRLLSGLAGLALPALAPAEGSWPDRVIRIINPYAAGGPSDAITRLLAEGMSSELGQRVIIESKPGGGTVIGAGFVAKSAPDGYTLLLATVAPLVVQPIVNSALPYDAHKDFALVGMFATVPNLITVNPAVPAASIRELIALAQKEPGKLSYASAGAGTGPHLGGELFSEMAKVKLTHVPYAGAAPAVLGVLGGQVDISFVNITPQIAHVKAGKLRALAAGSKKRSSLFPDVPTMAESGLPGYVSESWNGLAAPAGTPRAVIDRLYQAMDKVMSTPAMQEALRPLGAEITLAGPEEFAAYVKNDEKVLGPVIRSLRLVNN
jgi:tripartite-type tricarboxylate transporter receptor subunit TctC